MKLNAFESHTISNINRDIQVGIAIGTMTEDSGIHSRQWQDIFLFSTAFRPVLGPTQLPI
jgi:hypothetical protein